MNAEEAFSYGLLDIPAQVSAVLEESEFSPCKIQEEHGYVKNLNTQVFRLCIYIWDNVICYGLVRVMLLVSKTVTTSLSFTWTKNVSNVDGT